MLARTVENKALPQSPLQAGRDKHGKTKKFRAGGLKKEKKHHDLIMENRHTVCELTYVSEKRGSRREAKLAHVADVMRERFEDDCLLSMVSRADNQELE